MGLKNASRGLRRALLVLLTLLVVLVAGCDWTTFRYDAAGTGFNGTENKIGVANVGSLVKKWFGWTEVTPDWDQIRSSPVVANGVVYSGGWLQNLYAFSAGGCSNAECNALWQGITGEQGGLSSPSVANGVAYMSTSPSLVAAPVGKLFAFDAAGSTGCSGVPKTCAPLWKATTTSGMGTFSPVVVNGVVYVAAGTADHTLYAFDAGGNTGCSGVPKTCTPLWTATGASEISTANGVLYVGSGDGHLYAYDAAGTTGCSGVPKTCAPLWSATGVGSPVVANGVVYIGSSDGKVYGYDAAGTTGCSGVPKTCTPRWKTTTGGGGPLAIANHVLYASSYGTLFAFDATGTTGCSGVPTTCTPLWTTGSANIGGYPWPRAANGVVYVGSTDVSNYQYTLYAYDAAGSTHCSGAPKVCTPLWRTTIPHKNIYSSPTIANGVVYLHADPAGALYAYGLP